ncbi:hypothetical protein HH310_24970 [Actinoplanes sp. TBRC 11911]|uniref:hypothetical protein n=1 Tax=Actinoplanes sp. TBRC 11911 TaxID=2729386 RepID=UPI00145F73C6|nr:hypothetical protein [Actinoplanes sp. TBRC 11911]NMO54423.1 hypothetical protein [Actinoplanes sp. TBRC 11911]
MSRQFRYRMTALALGGLIFGMPMLAAGTASADPVHENGQLVIFDGGSMLDLSCESQPNVESLTVPAESTVMVVNNTGYSADLRLGGDTKGTLADHGATEVVFRRGTTAVVMEPNCPFPDDATPLLVTAAASPAATMPDPTPAPSDDRPAVDTATETSAPAASVMSGSGSTAQRPSRLQQARPQQPDALRAAVNAMPPGGAAPRSKTKDKVKPVSRTPEGRAHAFTGMPPGDAKTVVTGVPQMDLAPMIEEREAVAPAQPGIAAAEPVAAMEPISHGGPTGLLGVIAAVCVLGVGAAAIRAIVSQRANRSKVA